MFEIEFANIMCVVSALLGFTIIMLFFEFDIFQTYLKQKYDIYSEKTGRLTDIIEEIEKQKWMHKMEIIETQLSLLQLSNDVIIDTLEKLRLCRESTE